MKVVFVASHTQQKELGVYYKRAVKFLEDKGLEVTSGSLFDDKLAKEISSNREQWYKQSIHEVQKADLVVVEISYPSTANVGHELTYALEIGKPVIAIYHKDKEPVFLRGREDEKLLLFEYNDSDIENILDAALEYATDVQDVRFNFFISPSIGRYLDWVSKNKRVPRAVFLRKLIEQEMQADKAYEEAEK
jgi:nucleoside 2-deoxyribosyltransferase